MNKVLLVKSRRYFLFFLLPFLLNSCEGISDGLSNIFYGLSQIFGALADIMGVIIIIFIVIYVIARIIAAFSE